MSLIALAMAREVSPMWGNLPPSRMAGDLPNPFLVSDAELMTTNNSSSVQTNAAARAAALAGTRQLMLDDTFEALVAALVDCNAVPRAVMAATLERLASKLIAKARGELETEWALYPSEIFERARKLDAMAARFRSATRR